MFQFYYINEETKQNGVIVSGDVSITFRKFTSWAVDPVETRTAYIEGLIANPVCDIRTGSTKFMGWEFRFSNVKKYIVRTDTDMGFMYGFSVNQLREAADLKRTDKIMVAPKGW